MKQYSKIILSILFILYFNENLHSQSSRDYIKIAIEKWGECRTVAITKTNGDVAVYAKCGFAAKGVPQNFIDAISEHNKKNELIDDICLTEEGRYIILYGNNGCEWNDIPYSLENKLKAWNYNNEIINSITFNDANLWIVISNGKYSASDSWILQILQEGEQKHGELLTACISNDAMVFVYRHGYRYYGNVPESLKTSLSTATFPVYRIKIAGSSWFYANKNGSRYNYYM